MGEEGEGEWLNGGLNEIQIALEDNFSNVHEQPLEILSVRSLCEVTEYVPLLRVRVQGTELSHYKGPC